jgi:hypothetical protein
MRTATLRLALLSAWCACVCAAPALLRANIWKSFGPIDLTVTMPSGGLVVMEPAPTAQPTVADERVTYTARLEKVDGNFRLAWLPASREGRSALFALPNRSDLAGLRSLEKSVTHPQARRVLSAMIAMADQDEVTPQRRRSELRGIDNLMGAGFSPEKAIAIAAPDNDSGMRGGTLDGLLGTYRYMRRLAESGFEQKITFDEPILRMSEEDRQIAARWLAKVEGKPATPEARLARAYVALLGTPEPTAAQIDEFFQAARVGDAITHQALKLNARSPGDPRCFAPLVMEFLAKPAPKTTVPDPTPWNMYVAALDAFAHGAAAPVDEALRMIDGFDDYQVARSYRVAELNGPAIGYERMHAICDRLARSPKHPSPDGWIRALNRLDSARTAAAMDVWAKNGFDGETEKRIREQLRRGY